MPNLTGKICLVTGASKGIGRGIAIQLITYGATCYITGRDITSLEKVMNEANSRGSTGKCIPIQCDHSIDTEVESVFKKISDEQNGKLDLLVNNAYAAVKFLLENAQYYFWDLPPETYDVVNKVGLRNNYICSVFASRMMVPRRKGLIINISSVGGKGYLFLPQYGIGKAGKDKMAYDCAVELKQFNVAFISLWPGPVKTETISEACDSSDQIKEMFANGESTELSGKCIAYMLADERIINKSGRIILTCDVADEYGFNDIDGSRPTNVRRIRDLVAVTPLSPVSILIPGFFKIPFTLLTLLASWLPQVGKKLPSKYE